MALTTSANGWKTTKTCTLVANNAFSFILAVRLRPTYKPCRSVRLLILAIALSSVLCCHSLCGTIHFKSTSQSRLQMSTCASPIRGLFGRKIGKRRRWQTAPTTLRAAWKESWLLVRAAIGVSRTRARHSGQLARIKTFWIHCFSLPFFLLPLSALSSSSSSSSIQSISFLMRSISSSVKSFGML